jgi:hypothetical protein
MLSILLVFSVCSDGDLPFDDEADSNIKYGEDFDVPTPTPPPTPIPLPPFPQLPISSLFGIRELFLLLMLFVYLLWFWLGYRDCRRVESRVTETIIAQLQTYYAAVPDRFVKPHLHRMDAFATGRVCHKGVLITIDLTKRCDPLGFLWDTITNHSSVLAFEFIVDPQYEIPGFFHISRKTPGFVRALNLAEFSVSDEKLKGFTDMGDHRHAFLPLFNRFIETHRGMLRLVEISDINRFQLIGECRFVARMEFQFRKKDEEFVFSHEIVDFALSIADKFATMRMDADVIARNNATRQAALMSVKEKVKTK